MSDNLDGLMSEFKRYAGSVSAAKKFLYLGVLEE